MVKRGAIQPGPGRAPTANKYSIDRKASCVAYLTMSNTDFGVFDVEMLKDKGTELHDQYANAAPFPHIAIDDFLPAATLDKCLQAFPNQRDPDSMAFDRDQERFKTSYNPDYLSAEIRALFYSFNSRPFIRFLENLTGIQKLVPDPFFLGGGFHEIRQGGHLSVHADFNFHKQLHLERRLNVLIYLNHDWQPEYGGALELWDQDMTGAVQSINPSFNRCVVFTTTGDSFHGNPQPVNHPNQQPRRSIALYYYTATWDERAKSYTTQFKPRPGSQDRPDWRVKTGEVVNDVLPPIASRAIARIRHKITK